MKKVILSIVALATCGSMMAGVTPHFGAELGYDHGWAHVRTPDLGYSYYFDNANMDGFHVGGNLLLDFSQGQHVPGLLIGVNYQFLANNMGRIDQKTKEELNTFKETAKDLGATGITAYDYAFMHSLQIPVRFHYTYQVNNNWRITALTGPQVRLHLSFNETYEGTYRIDGKKYGSTAQMDYVSGKETINVWVKSEKETSTVELDNLALMDMFDMSWGFGLGVGWQNISLNFTYDLGMINLFNKDLNGWRYNSDALAVTLGFRLK